MLYVRSRILIASSLAAQAAGTATVAAQSSGTSAERILAHVTFLADDAREGRGVGTAGLDSAAQRRNGAASAASGTTVSKSIACKSRKDRGPIEKSRLTRLAR